MSEGLKETDSPSDSDLSQPLPQGSCKTVFGDVSRMKLKELYTDRNMSYRQESLQRGRHHGRCYSQQFRQYWEAAHGINELLPLNHRHWQNSMNWGRQAQGPQQQRMGTWTGMEIVHYTPGGMSRGTQAPNLYKLRRVKKNLDYTWGARQWNMDASLQAYLYGQENGAKTNSVQSESPFSPTPLLFINNWGGQAPGTKIRYSIEKIGEEKGRAIYSGPVA